jgi:hypothetical protein
MVVDYGSEQNLIYSLSGIDLVISFVCRQIQLLLIDAALKAGISRFAPAEFSGSPEHRSYDPVLDKGHWAALNRLDQHVEERMQYTAIVCGLKDVGEVRSIGSSRFAGGKCPFCKWRRR